MKVLSVTVEEILAARREDLSAALQAGRHLRGGSAWIYATQDVDPRPKVMVLPSPRLDDLIEAAQTDGIFQFGLAALSWVPLVTLVQRVMWLWVEIRGIGGFVYTAPVRESDLGEWSFQLELPPRAIPVTHAEDHLRS